MDVGSELWAMRRSIGMTHEELAAEMRARGFPKWSASAVSRIESGKQHLRFADSLALRAIERERTGVGMFGLTREDLAVPSAVVNAATHELEMLASTLSDAFERSRYLTDLLAGFVRVARPAADEGEVQ